MFQSEKHLDCVKRKYPWFRDVIWEPYKNPRYHMSVVPNRNRPMFQKFKQNKFLDIQTKRAALKASPSVVSLISYTGEQELIQCCGVIIENDGNNGYIILTSTKLLRCRTEENVLEDKLADNLKVVIHLYDGESYEGQVRAYDFHYNLSWIQFQSNSSIPTAKLREVDEYINVNPAENSFNLLPHSSRVNLVPGHAIIAIGRYFVKPFYLMAAPGEFNIDRCDDFDCKELYTATCLITECGEGGPLINLSGEVIGITFFERGYTPFLPINIGQKCWEHYKRYGVLWRPFLGIVATNLYAVDISDIEKVIQKVPSICNGVVVEKVIKGSSLDSAGIHVDDVIVQCGGKTVHSFLELLEMVWDKKVGDILQLVVVRVFENDPIHVNMVVDEVAVENFYRWPCN